MDPGSRLPEPTWRFDLRNGWLVAVDWNAPGFQAAWGRSAWSQLVTDHFVGRGPPGFRGGAVSAFSASNFRSQHQFRSRRASASCTVLDFPAVLAPQDTGRASSLPAFVPAGHLLTPPNYRPLAPPLPPTTNAPRRGHAFPARIGRALPREPLWPAENRLHTDGAFRESWIDVTPPGPGRNPPSCQSCPDGAYYGAGHSVGNRSGDRQTYCP